MCSDLTHQTEIQKHVLKHCNIHENKLFMLLYSFNQGDEMSKALIITGMAYIKAP